MANYEVLEPGGHAALVDGLKDYADREGGVGAEQLADGSVNLDKLDEDVLDVLDTKADIDGYYAQLTAGAADNLTGRGDATTAEFLYRTAGGTADIETGQAVAKSVKGNTLVWNQLCNGVNTAVQVAGVTKTVTSSGGLSAHGTVTTTPDYGLLYIGANTVLQRDGRKYLFMLSKEVGFPIGVSGYGLSAANYRRAFIWSNTAGGVWNGSLVAYVSEGDTVDFDDVHASVFDLTQMFGAGNEPSTVAEFEALFPEPYYEYDAGSLLSVNMEGVETVGFNQYNSDENPFEVKNFDGQDSPSHGNASTKGYISVVSGMEYEFRHANISGVGGQYIRFYDANKAELPEATRVNIYNTTGSFTFTVPSNAAYVRIMLYKSSGITVTEVNASNPCLHLVWSGRRNGEYEAFWKSQRLIDVETYFPDGMRSAGSVCDELTSTEAIQRVGVVDLGTLTWFKASDASKQFIVGRSNFPDLEAWSDISKVGNVVCTKYTTVKYNDASALYGNIDKTIAVGGTTNAIAVLDYAYENATAAEFKTAMSGVMLYYAVKTPTVAPIDPPLNLSYRVDDFGTERIMVSEDERSAPPVLDIAYGLNVVDFVRRAPSEYMSHASMSQFRLALMSHFGIFINETWDEVDNRYEYTITSE